MRWNKRKVKRTAVEPRTPLAWAVSIYRRLWGPVVTSSCRGSVAEHWQLKSEVFDSRRLLAFFTFLYFHLITSNICLLDREGFFFCTVSYHKSWWRLNICTHLGGESRLKGICSWLASGSSAGRERERGREWGREGGREKERKERKRCSQLPTINLFILTGFSQKLHVEGVESLVLLPRRNVTSSMQSC